MIVKYIPLDSKSGFTSPGFSVDETGNLSASSINSLGSLLIGGLPFISGSSLATTITGSNLQTLGTLTALHAGTDSALADVLTVTSSAITTSSLATISVSNGIITIDPTNSPNQLSVGPAGASPVQLNVSGQIAANSTTDTTSTSTGAVVVQGGVGIGKDLQVGGDTYITGNTYIAGQNIKALAAALAVALS